MLTVGVVGVHSGGEVVALQKSLYFPVERVDGAGARGDAGGAAEVRGGVVDLADPAGSRRVAPNHLQVCRQGVGGGRAHGLERSLPPPEGTRDSAGRESLGCQCGGSARGARRRPTEASRATGTKPSWSGWRNASPRGRKSWTAAAKRWSTRSVRSRSGWRKGRS